MIGENKLARESFISAVVYYADYSLNYIREKTQHTHYIAFISPIIWEKTRISTLDNTHTNRN